MFAPTDQGQRPRPVRFIVLFAAAALLLALLPAAPANASLDAVAPQIAMLSLNASGQQGPYGDSRSASISRDGTIIAFHSSRSLTADDTNSTSDIYVRDLSSNTITRIAPLHDDFSHPRVNASLDPDISADGRYISFEANLVDAGLPCESTDLEWHIFLFDRATATTICLSQAADGSHGNNTSNDPAIAGAAGTVAFASAASNFSLGNLPAGDQNSKYDIFVADIQRNAQGAPTGASLSIVSLGPTGVQANGRSGHPDISADGQIVVFDSQASNLSPADADTVSDIYRYDRASGQIALLTAAFPESATNPALSADGRQVAFQVTNGAGDSRVYVYDVTSGIHTLVSLGADGLAINGSGPAISPDGLYVSFSGGDVDSPSILVYDRAAGRSHLVTVAVGGGAADGASYGPSLTMANGLRIAFNSTAENLLPAEPYPGSWVNDIYLATFPIVATIAQGNGQRAVINQAFSQQLAVQVRTTLGSPVAGFSVAYMVPTAGAGASFPGPAASALALSDSLGLARAPQLTANGTAGTFSVLASVGDAGILAFQLTSSAASNPCDAAGLPPRLVPSQGGRWYLSGVNVPWQNGGFGADFATVEEWGNWHAYTHAATEQMFADLEAKGVNSVRWWVFVDGRGGPQFDALAGGAVTGLDSTTLPNMADAILLAAEHDIYIVFNLWSFDMLMADSTASAKGEHAGGHSDLITDAAKRSSFITNALLPMLAYPVPGSGYSIGSHPNVLGWDIFNEPEYGISDLGEVDAKISQPVSLAQMRRFVAEVAGAIHRNSHQLVTLGSASLKWNSDQAPGATGNLWKDSALTPYDSQGFLDFYQIHYYGWMNGDGVNWSYSPMTVSRAAAGLDKPTIIGELPANAVDTGYTVAGMLDGIYAKCYGGAWAWSYEGVDENGAWADVADPIGQFNLSHAGEVGVVAAEWGPAAPTATGTQVTVAPVPGLEVTFAEVSDAGGTAALVGDASSTPLPRSYLYGADPQVYDIVTTAGYTGAITLQLSYDGALFSDEERIRLLHNEGGSWVDRSSSLDLANNRITAVVGGFSEFALVEERPVLYLPLVIRR